MSRDNVISYHNKVIKLSDKNFERVKHHIDSQIGIELKNAKKQLVESRLLKRIRTLRLGSFDEYLNMVLVKHPDQEEYRNFIDAITTNKTDFFRESNHFTFLEERLKQKAGFGSVRNVRVWSAACSSGEEPYTLAMVLENLRRAGTINNFEIVASDISWSMLQSAVKAEYQEKHITGIPLEFRKKYLLKHKDRIIQKFKIKKDLRRKIKFMQINLHHPVWPNFNRFDFIFCRNTYIYFDQAHQKQLTLRFLDKLTEDGLLFLGHSESLNGYGLPVRQVHSTVYEAV